MVKKEIKDNGVSRSAISLTYNCLHDLYRRGYLERYTPKELVENCMEECEEKNIRNILSCFRKGRCEKNIYPRMLMEELNPKRYRSGYRTIPYIYKLKDNYGAY